MDISENYVISGSEDKTVKVWTFDQGKVLQTLRDHQGEVIQSII